MNLKIDFISLGMGVMGLTIIPITAVIGLMLLGIITDQFKLTEIIIVTVMPIAMCGMAILMYGTIKDIEITESKTGATIK